MNLSTFWVLQFLLLLISSPFPSMLRSLYSLLDFSFFFLHQELHRHYSRVSLLHLTISYEPCHFFFCLFLSLCGYTSLVIFRMCGCIHDQNSCIFYICLYFDQLIDHYLARYGIQVLKSCAPFPSPFISILPWLIRQIQVWHLHYTLPAVSDPPSSFIYVLTLGSTLDSDLFPCSLLAGLMIYFSPL